MAKFAGDGGAKGEPNAATSAGGTGGTGGAAGSRADKIARVLHISWILQREEVSIEYLAKKFNVTRRTIFRDLKTISQAQLPVAIIHGRDGLRMVHVTEDGNFIPEGDCQTSPE